MTKRYYKYATGPVYSEEKPKGVIRFYAFQMETEDFTYMSKILHDLSGEAQEITQNEFEDYVNQLKRDNDLG